MLYFQVEQTNPGSVAYASTGNTTPTPTPTCDPGPLSYSSFNVSPPSEIASAINSFAQTIGGSTVSGGASFSGTLALGDCCTSTGNLIQNGRSERSGNVSATIEIDYNLLGVNQEIESDDIYPIFDFTTSIQVGVFLNGSLSVSGAVTIAENICEGTTNFSGSKSASASVSIEGRGLVKICWGPDESQCWNMGVIPVGASTGVSASASFNSNGTYSGTVTLAPVTFYTQFNMPGFTSVQLGIDAFEGYEAGL